MFEKKDQPHSCRKIPLGEHFTNKETAKEIFDYLVSQIEHKIGKCRIISLPCCIHLFGNYDFLAALPKKDRLEIRFTLDRKLESTRLTQAAPMSLKIFKNCLGVFTPKNIDKELLKWLDESYHLKS